MTTTLQKLAEIAGGEVIGDGSVEVEAITLDSRLVESEHLFAAVRARAHMVRSLLHRPRLKQCLPMPPV